ncbi:DUF4352 domain-containing protein [Streptomyces bambusae]|uniref:DUF4352 domain-containing protein n=1 Tax=Streptomyces bambusae TaxID=1550616 RepID=UPI001CFCA42A|nr:DUF4352 domain-containing protein [Streptomyces bambusae]MCB5166360.1 DUF4352 domain-containing protein [Streptomyces bambusae]
MRPATRPLMRHSAPLSLTLVPLLLLGAAGCAGSPGSAPAGPAAAPAPAAPGAQDDRAADAPQTGPKAREARLGEPVHLRGRKVGQHLQAVVDAYVDPAVSAEKAFTPAKGTRWVGADMSFVNVGGASYGALGRVWAVDADGREHPAVRTGKLTTGAPLVFEPLEVGDRAEGWVVFEIPENVRIVRLQYKDANILPNSGEGHWHV